MKLSELGGIVDIPTLEDKEWKRFRIFEEGILSIQTTGSSIDGIRLVNDGTATVPYITRSDASNGIARFVSESNYDYGSDDGGCITVGLDTQTAFWQSHKFVTGQNIQVITGKWLNEFSAMFLIPLLRGQMAAKFNWGGNGATLGRMKKLNVMLPVNDSGEPDYEYMEQYAKNMMIRKYRQYIAYLERELTEIERERANGPLIALEDKEWTDFRICDIATVDSGRDIYAQERIPGDTPYITSGVKNNGIGYFVGNDNDSLASNAVSVARNGAVGEAFYHPYKALYGNDCRRVNLIHAHSKFVQLLVAFCISKQKATFSYSRKLGTERLKSLHIMLPVTDSGEPDYEYMEQYGRAMMANKYRQYLKYLQG